VELIEGVDSSEYVLDSEASFELLRSSRVGRVAVNGPWAPLMFPINYSLDGGAVVFMASEEMCAAINRESAVTFQNDGYDKARNAAWNIVIKGIVEKMRNNGHLEMPVGFAPVAPEPWSVRGDGFWMRIVPETVEGTLAVTEVIDIT
jgi:nitroimidazol reductase NimA-like FMN-containing flavoprotein (pyridoxamine 5'-phosphate oxidase superfamily)